jgi:hypothetical protein
MPTPTTILRRALVRLVNQAELTDDYAESEHSTLRSAVKQARAALDYLDHEPVEVAGSVTPA